MKNPIEISEIFSQILNFIFLHNVCRAVVEEDEIQKMQKRSLISIRISHFSQPRRVGTWFYNSFNQFHSCSNVFTRRLRCSFWYLCILTISCTGPPGRCRSSCLPRLRSPLRGSLSLGSPCDRPPVYGKTGLLQSPLPGS